MAYPVNECVVNSETITSALDGASYAPVASCPPGKPARIAYWKAVRFKMPVRIVNSKQNSRLKELRRALRNPDRKTGVIGIEGSHLLEEADRAGLRIQTVFLGEDTANPHPESLRDSFPTSDVLLVPDAILRGALETETPQSVAALIQPPQWNWTGMLASTEKPLLLVLAGLQDPGNLGTILRSAEAFGANGIVALPGTVSPWNPKAMRASAGSVFRMPVIQASVDECFTRLREAGIRILTTAPTGATMADAIDFAAPTALVIGNEGNGVPPDIAARADQGVTIACPGPVESLNASVAAAVLLYEASRQRRTNANKKRGHL